MKPVDVREQLVDALRLDLVGPDHEDDRYQDEVLPSAPSRWYLSGFLVPYEASVEDRSDDTGDESLDIVGKERGGDDEQKPEEVSARKAFFPSSMGMTVLVPVETRSLAAEIHWGDYHPEWDDADSDKDETVTDGTHKPPPRWQRQARSEAVPVPLEGKTRPVDIEIPSSGGLRLVVVERAAGAAVEQAGARAVSIFLVNGRHPAGDAERDMGFVFQAVLSLACNEGFVPRPDLHSQQSTDHDDRVADLQYRDAFEYVVGHNISAMAETVGEGACRQVRTRWIPRAEVEKVVPRAIEGANLGMEALASAETAEHVREMVGPMVQAYAAWIEQQAGTPGLAEQRAEVAKDLLQKAAVARDRIDAGIELLSDPLVLEAFRISNQAIATAIRQRVCHDRDDLKPEDLDPPPSWRPFQLAFLLMNLRGVAEEEHPDRRTVDLLFFPTGGGKTEAYLGLAAFAMVLRRLRDPSIQSAGHCVLMRYTLRLLTLDQLGRAATLVCALELERQKDPEKLGRWPLEIGLWVGQTATPNRMGKKGDRDQYSARKRTLDFQNDDRKPSPIPLENCPWCGEKFTRNSFTLLPDADNPTDLRVACVNRRCAFSTRRVRDGDPDRRGLPILAVDEPIYRRLPAFIIATVDKFANLPWVGQTAGLFGRVTGQDADGFYGPWDKVRGRPLDSALPPPALIIQDELHLISGPLGTMVGLYETAVDALCGSGFDDHGVRPKVVASTATVRRAEKQVSALFCRSGVEVFPPPGPDRRDSFFAETVPPGEKNARSYLGVAAQGRNLKVVLMHTYLALLGAAQRLYLQEGGAKNKGNPADPYMTIVGYFNALRELGGSRRIVEDEVRSRLVDHGKRRRRVGETGGLFADRPKLQDPMELTSRVSTNLVADTKRRLALPYHNKEHVDVVLASNMISVGLDITRLGLMVVTGQPKMAAEYIQATSRVGRDDERPGLVVTLLNIHRPRDRSHYERFEAWHESFYRAVEATSVTPFSPRAVDRGLAGVTVALARLGHPGMTPPEGAGDIGTLREELEYVPEVISRRAEAHDAEISEADAEALRRKIKDRVEDLMDDWAHLAADKGEMQYQREKERLPPLLFDPLDRDLVRQPLRAHKFKAGRSLRDVEHTVNLWLRRPDTFDAEAEKERRS